MVRNPLKIKDKNSKKNLQVIPVLIFQLVLGTTIQKIFIKDTWKNFAVVLYRDITFRK
jgi:hypothetical protein